MPLFLLTLFLGIRALQQTGGSEFPEIESRIRQIGRDEQKKMFVLHLDHVGHCLYSFYQYDHFHQVFP